MQARTPLTVLQGSKMRVAVKSIVAKDTWSVAKGKHSGKPFVLRYRQEFREKPDVSAYPKLLKVTWSFHGGEPGMPDNSTSEAMGMFEDRLVSAVESDLSAVLVAVVTTDNTRMWVYHASSVPTFSERLHYMPQEVAPYPIEIEAVSDPEWRFVYDTILPDNENP